MKLYLLLILSAIANSNVSANASLPLAPSTLSSATSVQSQRHDGVATASAATTTLSTKQLNPIREDWRQHLPEKLRNKKGAPLHRIEIESETQPWKKVTVYLLGTSHVSRTSCQDAKLLMEHARPDVLFVELCSNRVGILLSGPPNPSEQDNTYKIDVQQEDATSNNEMTPTSQRMSVLFAKIQSDYAKKLNVTIGGEFRSAFQSALSQQQQFWQSSGQQHTSPAFVHSRGSRPCAIILGDRPVRLTLLRAWESLSAFGKLKLVLALLWSSIRQPSEKELQEWMDSILNDRTGENDLMTKAMEEMGKAFPTLKRVIIEERDEFMVAKLRQTAEMLMQSYDLGENNHNEMVMVAVVGAGHCSGILEKLTTKNQNGCGLLAKRPELVLPSLVETKKRKISNDEEVSSLVTDVVQFDYSYVLGDTPQ